MISRDQIIVPEFYLNYVSKAGDDDLQKALRSGTKRFSKVVEKIPGKKVDYAYGEGKWTIKQLMQHIIDAERVFVLRAVWFTRRDPSPQPSFEENIWAENADVSVRKWKDMVKEFLHVRAATELFFSSLPNEALTRTGTAGSSTLSAAALGFITAGHLHHHIDILEERYLRKYPAKEKIKKDKDSIAKQKKH